MSVAAVALALAAPQAAAAATTIGAPTLAGTPQAGEGCPSRASLCTTVFTTARATAPGVVVAWRVRAQAGSQQLALRAAREGDGTWILSASDATPRTVAGGAVETFPARMPIAAGNALALDAAGVPAARDPLAGGTLAVFGGALQAFARAPDVTLPGGLLMQADVEPDSDGDGFGDETQDECPAEAARQAGPCAAALSVATAGAPQWGVVGEPVTHSYRVANSGPSTARDIVVNVASARFVSVSAAGGACTAATCSIARLAAGESAEVSVTVRGSVAGDVLASSATITSGSLDDGAGDNAASAATTLTPPSVAPPPSVFVVPACANVKVGTNDDELLDGSSFGDRLVGRGGRDLIHGYAADDCLEGGRGGDVLGGGFGHDRLVGGYGPDRLYGESGNDSLKAGNGDDSLSGGSGKDALLPGPGADRVFGGPGDDTVSARDRTRDRIDCGPGRDRARVDRVDRVKGCESVSRR